MESSQEKETILTIYKNISKEESEKRLDESNASEAVDIFFKKIETEPSISLDSLDDFISTEELCSLFFSKADYQKLENKPQRHKTIILLIALFARLKANSTFQKLIIRILIDIVLLGFIGLMLYLNSTNLTQFVNTITQNIPLITCLSIFIGIRALVRIYNLIETYISRCRLNVLKKSGASPLGIVTDLKIKKTVEDAIEECIYQKYFNQTAHSYCFLFLSIAIANSALNIIASSCSLAMEYSGFNLKWLIISIVIFIQLIALYCGFIKNNGQVQVLRKVFWADKLLTELATDDKNQNISHLNGKVINLIDEFRVDHLSSRSSVNNVKSEISPPYSNSGTLLRTDETQEHITQCDYAAHVHTI